MRRRRNWSSRAFSTIDQKMSIAPHSRPSIGVKWSRGGSRQAASTPLVQSGISTRELSIHSSLHMTTWWTTSHGVVVLQEASPLLPSSHLSPMTARFACLICEIIVTPPFFTRANLRKLRSSVSVGTSKILATSLPFNDTPTRLCCWICDTLPFLSPSSIATMHAWLLWLGRHTASTIFAPSVTTSRYNP